MAKQWFYKRGEQEYGPLGHEELRQRALAGQVHPDDLVRHGGMKKWIPARCWRGLLPEPQVNAATEEPRQSPVSVPVAAEPGSSSADRPVKLFLSYARDDDEAFVKDLYQDLTRRGFDVWWDRVSMPSRRLTFHQEIRDAVAACDRLVLVIGPQAIQSDYVRQEWQFAWYQAEKIVTPILRIGNYPVPLDELKRLHCEDFTKNDEYTTSTWTTWRGNCRSHRRRWEH